MALILPADVAALNVAASMQYQAAFAAVAPWYQTLATQISIGTTSARFPFIPDQDVMRQWVGARVVRDVEAQVFNVIPAKFEKTVQIERDDYLDQQMAGFQMAMANMGTAAAKWPDQRVVAEIIANNVCYDALSFYNLNHPLDPAGVQANTGTLALTAANYAITREAMLAFTGADGMPLSVNPNLLVVPPQLERQGKEILIADIITDPGGVGTAGVSNVNKGSASLMVLPELAVAAGTWYLFDVSKPIKPYVFVLREAPIFVSKQSPDDDEVFWNDRLTWGVQSRGEAAPTLWHLGYRQVT